MPRLQRQRVARLGDGDVLHDAGRGPPVALDDMRDRRQVPALLRRRGQGASGGQGLARHRHAGGLGAQQVQPGAQRVAHHKARAVLERLADRRHRVAGVDLEFREGLSVELARVGARPAESVAQPISSRRHVVLSFASVVDASRANQRA